MASLQEALLAAVDHVQAGRTAEADILLDRILEAVPEQPDALHLQGVLLGQAGRIAEAADRFERAVAQRPESPDLQLNLARACRALGRTERAADALRAVLGLDPDAAGARAELAGLILGLGRQREGEGRLRDAEALYREAAGLCPDQPDALFHLGGILQDSGQGSGQDSGRSDEALAAYDAALAIQPDFENAWINRALLHAARGNGERAAADWRAALACDPARPRVLEALAAAREESGDWGAAALLLRRAAVARWPDAEPGAVLRLSMALNAAGRLDEAAGVLRALAVAEPGQTHAWSNLGAVLRRREEPDGALDKARIALDRARTLAPDDATVLANRANLMLAVGDAPAAEAEARRAVEADARCAAAHINLGTALTLQNRVGEAVRSFREALALDGGNLRVKHDLGFCLIATGALEEGWPATDLRWALPDNGLPDRGFPQPLWNGEPVGGTLLAWGEQGLGDEIMFAGLLPELAGEGVDLVIECDDRLVPLFRRSFPRAEVVPRRFPAEPRLLAPDIAAQTPTGSLPRWRRRRMADFARAPSPYLAADPALVALWRERLGDDGRLRVGVSWRSGNAVKGAARSIPLADLGRAFAGLPVRLINLQYGDVGGAIAEARAQGIEVEAPPGSDPRNDIDGMAALIAALDLVVSIDNTTVHLAGALGAPVWTLLPFAAEWRWFLDREDSPWYPSMRLFRQPQAGAWAPVLDRVRAEAALEVAALAKSV